VSPAPKSHSWTTLCEKGGKKKVIENNNPEGSCGAARWKKICPIPWGISDRNLLWRWMLLFEVRTERYSPFSVMHYVISRVDGRAGIADKRGNQNMNILNDIEISGGNHSSDGITD
jgi:hypothetical protein